jgi:hypothetical protein
MSNIIELSKKQSKAWHYLTDKTTTEIVYGGGAGGGKSYLGCIWHINNRLAYPKSRGLIGRAKISNLEQSTLVTLRKVAGIMGYKEGVHFKYNNQKHVITWANGSESVLKDLFFYPSDPDFISLGSTEYTDAFIDEATEITLKAFEIVNTRIRWMLNEFNLVPKIFLTCNPSDSWIKERYISKNKQRIELKEHQKYVQSLLIDNPDEAFKSLYMQQLENLSSDYDKARLLNGDWDAERQAVNPFAFEYDPMKHESVEAKFDAQRELIISLDFNINPFSVMFAHIFRKDNKECVHIFDEIAVENGSIPKMVEIIKSRYGHKLHTCRITGDAMGKRGDISQRDNATLYEQLMRGLGLNSRQLYLPANPTHENSKADVNYALRYFPEFKINPVTCPYTCQDFRTVQVDAFGGIIKRNRTDLSQRADFLDAGRYLVNTFLKKWILDHQKFNKK